MKKIIVFFICNILLTSCGIYGDYYLTDPYGNSKDVIYSHFEIFQTLNKYEALARTRNFDVVKIVTENETYYDGKKLSGKFHLIDTYTYVTVENNIKTIPVYTRIDDNIGSDIGKTKFIHVEIIQTLSKYEALAWDSDYNVVKIETAEDIYYDGKKISGIFYLTGVYEYTNKKGTEKTVPVYVKEDEYKRYMLLN